MKTGLKINNVWKGMLVYIARHVIILELLGVNPFFKRMRLLAVNARE